MSQVQPNLPVPYDPHFAKATLRQQLNRMLLGLDRSIQRAVKNVVNTLRSSKVLREIADLFRRATSPAAGVEEALNIVDVTVSKEFTGLLSRGLVNAAEKQMAASQVGVTFDPYDPTLARAAKELDLKLIRGFTQQQRQVTRRALVEGMTSGASDLDIARNFRSSIGLTPAQDRYVRSYRAALEAGSSNALNRQARDRRFDGTVERAIDEDDIIPPDKIDRMVDRYRERLVALRAETIARTESTRAHGEAALEAGRQMQGDVEAADDEIVFVWSATKDGRTRDSHLHLDGQRRTKAELDAGKLFNGLHGDLRYPGDPNAPASETINCRCSLLTELKPAKR